MKRRRRPLGLAARLLAAQTLVAAVAAVTLWLIATLVGPTVFHDHLQGANVHVTSATSRHVEDAFRSASAISIGVALLASLAVATGVSVFVARRIADPVARLAGAARAIAAGQYGTRVEALAVGGEFGDLTTAFNAMAARLETVEATRRRLLADLAHETRTPIATIDGYLQGIQDGVVDMDDATVVMLRGQTTRLTRLAEDITAVSEAEEHQLELHRRTVGLAPLIGSAEQAARDRFSAKGVELGIRIQSGLPALNVDPDRIGQMLGNLLDNALRHTPPGGSVTITAANAPDVDAVTVTVTDTGDGIAAEHLPHVFERFYRADHARDRAHGGSGIGLAITKALAHAHDGTISAVSAGSGRGAAFTITIPTR